MSVNLTNAQKEVIRKIIYAVETGGQVYGGVRYDDFTEAYTNSSVEHAITIGGGAWYATEAQRLLKLIRTTDSALFKKLDTAGIGSDLDSKDWSTYKLSKSSAKAKCIQKIISSNVGIKCQDSLIDSQMQKYIDEAATLGVTDVAAQIMCANFRHQGGLSAMKRVVAKTKKPYTLDNLYAACQTDTGNQVGAYKSRQKMVYNSLKKYLPKSTSSTTNTTGGKTMTENELRQKVVETAKKYLGCNESDGSHRKIIDGYNAHKPLARSYKVTYTDAWCATFVSFVSIQCGLTDIMPTECGCGAMIELYRKLGRWEENDAYVPKAGDIIMYYWNDNGVGDCTGYPDHVGIVVSVSGNTITVIEGNKSNKVAYRQISVNGRYIRGFCLPKYSSKATSSSGSTSNATPSAPSNNTQTSSGDLNKTVKWYGVTTDELNVRTWAGTGNKTCSFSPLKKGTKIGICDSVKASDGSVWYYIKYNSKYGFVHSGYVKKESASSATNTTSSNTSNKLSYAESKNSAFAGTYKTTDGLNIRTGAGTNFKVITTIPCGGTVHCYGYYTSVNGTNWYLVQYGTITGFVSSKYLKRA